MTYHPRSACESPCPIHSPSDHHMRDWPMTWRATHGYMERICPHGVGHPDPDSLAYLRRAGVDVAGIHGCDGCCLAATEEAEATTRAASEEGSGE